VNIQSIKACEIIDSRGWPTVNCAVALASGVTGQASVPSGASVGKHEAIELRDGDKNRYAGKGVLQAVAKINDVIASALCGTPADVANCDKKMCELDGTSNKSKLGANAILAVSMAVARAQARAEGLQLFQLIQRLANQKQKRMPLAMFNIINGGVHASNNLSFQEFMIVPKVGDCFADQLQAAVVIYNELKKQLSVAGLATGVGDEGGFAPCFGDEKQPEEAALDFLVAATEAAGFVPGKDIYFALDVAASELYDEKKNIYVVSGTEMPAVQLIAFYKTLCKNYPIVSIEDGLAQDDWTGWQALTKGFGDTVQLVGDDIFVTNAARIQQGIEKKVANAVLIKPNQIGTVSETLEAIALCQQNNRNVVVSHRSGETNDNFIADLAVGVGAEYLKAGAPARGERVAKYNRLLAIENMQI